MDYRRSPGAFILDAADSGLAAAVGLSDFGTSSRIQDLASKISLSATLLTKVGREVNRNSEYFKDNFQPKFETITVRYKKDYEIVLAALEKANTWKKDDSAEESEAEPPKQPWKKLLWALGMKRHEFDKVGEPLEEFSKQALLLQHVVLLVVLQIQAQERDLLPSEQASLRRVKKDMGELLESIRDADIASVLAFGLADPVKAANAVQVVEAAKSAIKEEALEDDASSTTRSVTIHNPSEECIPAPIMKQAIPPETSAMTPQEPEPEPEPEPPKKPDVFELYRANGGAHSTNVKHTLYRLFGVSFKVDHRETESGTYMNKVPASQDEIKALVEKNEWILSNGQVSAVETLANMSPSTSISICSLVNSRNDLRHPTHKWSVETLVPVPSHEKRFPRFWKRKPKGSDGYIVVLRGERTAGLGPGQQPPPPSNWPSGRVGGPPRRPPVIVMDEHWRRPPSTISVKERKSAAHIELTQQETERVINDFLASFSTLYDGVDVEKRGAVLNAIELPEEDDTDYDSDDTSSSGSRSLVDD